MDGERTGPGSVAADFRLVPGTVSIKRKVMAEYIHLVGAEQVQTAANTMKAAAEEMSRAASSIQEAIDRNQRFMDDWLTRFWDALPKK